MSAPVIPPRPTRAHGGPTAVQQDQPRVPPRPVRKIDPSPDREGYTRSPLNFLPNANGSAFKPPPAPEDLPRRPPSVNLPNEVGSEGIEYSSYDQLPAEAHRVNVDTPATKNVSADVPLHQPRASVPQSTVKRQISTVTRTDSTQAAAAGIGRAQPDDDVHRTPGGGESLSRVTSRTQEDSGHLRRVPSTEPHPLRQKTSFNRSSSSLQNGRPASVHSVDHYEGIPEIGQQIPLYPNAGDVQAPSPAPGQSQFAGGIGFFNDGSARAHHRKRSSRHEFGPPGSYGLHRSAESQDQFEKAWQEKHPDEALKEHYHPYMLRPETALSSEQLNRIVSQEGDIGMGTSPSAIGTPTQEIAFEATQAFTSRHNSPRPPPAPLTELRKKRTSSDHQPSTESPLRKESFLDAKKGSERALESEDEDVIHIDPPAVRVDKVTGGGPVDGAVNLGPTGGNTEDEGGWYVERGDGTPILASDEIVKRPSSAFLQPAVDYEEHHSDYDSDDLPPSRRGSMKPTSRPSSRPGSMHGGYQGGPLHRFISHEDHLGSGMGTPLEEIEEYEPLFPEGEEDEQKKREFKKRPGLPAHHFPSQDVWEDTPTSLQYQATVDTPEPPAPEKVAAANGDPAKVFETTEQEQARVTQNPSDMTADDKTFAKPHFKPGVREEVHRPGVQRFPSQDIWEDTPDSMLYVTTVSSPQMDEIKSPPEERPTTSALPSKQDDPEARSTTGYGLNAPRRPSVPERPQRRSKLGQEITSAESEDPSGDGVPDLGTDKEQVHDRSKPTVPDRPKPTIPARPARPSQSDGASLDKSLSAGSDEAVTSPPATQKVKPAVPARPAGSKIAALQSTFMNDLNNRLKLGPQAPPTKAKEAEPEPETAQEPLADARKGRARGPARRKPAAASSDAAFSFSMSTMTLWQIDENDELRVADSEVRAAGKNVETDGAALERDLTANKSVNTTEPTMHTNPESMTAETTDAPLPKEAIGAGGDRPAPAISEAVVEESEAVRPELEQALAQGRSEETAGPGVSDVGKAAGGAEMKEQAVQTGRTDMQVPSPTGERTKTMTAYVDGKAQEEGDVVVQEEA